MRIGLFDSGLGGLTVMREMIRLIPHLPITYFGDTARLPYGEKSPETVLRFCRESVSFLMNQGVDFVVMACHTASALTLESLQRECLIPLYGVINPSVDRAMEMTKSQRIAILGTRGTIASGVYQKAILQRRPDAHLVSIACPLFVPFVEEGLLDHPATQLIARDYLRPAIEKQVDTIILACTHYPLLIPLLQKELGEEVCLIDASKACAESVQRMCGPVSTIRVSETKHRFFVSSDPEKFRTFGTRFLNQDLGEVRLCSVDRQ